MNISVSLAINKSSNEDAIRSMSSCQLLVTLYKPEELEKVRTKGNKTCIEGLSTRIWHTSWISLGDCKVCILQVYHACTFCPLVTTFPLIGTTLPPWSADTEYCCSGPLGWLLGYSPIFLFHKKQQAETLVPFGIQNYYSILPQYILELLTC